VNLDRYISQQIRQWPLLFRDVDYEKSRTKVLDHLFLTIGNGYEWAEDGTMVAHYEESDPASDLLEFEEDFFTRPMLQPHEWGGVTTEIDQRSDHPWVPYSICKFSKIVTIPNNVRPDWLAAAREIYSKTVEFWSQPTEVLLEVLSEHRLEIREDVERFLDREIAQQKEWLEKIAARLQELG